MPAVADLLDRSGVGTGARPRGADAGTDMTDAATAVAAAAAAAAAAAEEEDDEAVRKAKGSAMVEFCGRANVTVAPVLAMVCGRDNGTDTGRVKAARAEGLSMGTAEMMGIVTARGNAAVVAADAFRVTI